MLRQRHHLFAVDKRHFKVNLRELRLAIKAQVFIPEAPGDLVVTIHAGDHQDLFEELRRLWQGEEHPGIHAAGHEIIARALRGTLRQHRRFHFQEALLVEKGPYAGGHIVAQCQQPLHAGPAQVQISVLETEGIGDLGAVFDNERRRLRFVEDLHALHKDLNVARGQFGIL